MQAPRRLALIRCVLVLAALSIVLIATWFPYSAALKRERAHLAALAENAAASIAPVAAAALRTADPDFERRLASALPAIMPRGVSGEFTLGRQAEDGRVLFLYRQDATTPTEPLAVPADPRHGVVMARGLLGGDAFPRGPDYRGEEVLAAFHPVPGTDLGIVAKVPLGEVQTPFMGALVGSATTAVLLVWLGVWVVQSTTARQLRTRQAYLQSIIDAVPQRILTLRRSGEVVDCNDPSGKPSSPGRVAPSAGDIFTGAFGDRARSELEALLEAAHQGRAGCITCSVDSSDGVRHWFSIRLVPFPSLPEGSPGALVTVEDITAPRKAATRLAEYAQHLKRIFDSDPDAAILIDPRTQCLIEVNSHAESLFGRSREELLQLALRDISTASQPGGRDLSSAEELLARGKEEVLTLEWRHVDRDGREFPCALRLVPMPSEQGVQVYCRIIDISARKYTEEWLHVQSRALEAAANGVIITEADAASQRIAYVNGAFERITGYSRKDVIGEGLALVLSESSQQPGVQELHAAMRNGDEASVVFRSYRRDGTPFWNEVYVAPVRDAAGRLTHYIGVLNDATARIEHEQRMTYQASHDLLTGLPNRFALSNRMADAISKAEASQKPFGVLFVDLDNFKLINNSRDHEHGDRLLGMVGERLVRITAPDHFVARYGGDEFVLVLPRVDSERELEDAATKVLGAISETFHFDDLEVVLTCSIGISLYPRDGRSVSTLLRNASAARYRAKELGRNQFQAYSDFLEQRASERLTLERELRRAIGTGEIYVVYQPKIALQTGSISGFEALVRWNHPVHGVISPAKFIPLAEESGLILPLGELVLLEAAIQIREWRNAGFTTSIAVNVSARQLDQPAFPSDVAKLLEDIGVDPTSLELELTENNIMRQADAMLPTLQRLKRFGVTLALDDFGTGYSSLAHLREFPFDCLKLDRCFTNNITDSAEDGAIVTAIMATQQLGLSVVAEGVETAEQARHLRRYGCEYGQGYYWSRPVPAEQATALLTQAYRWVDDATAVGAEDFN